MFFKNINKTSKKKTVLVVPLDWGLGHATRCIPLIEELLSTGTNVIIAAERQTRALLEREFQQLTFIDLQGYRVNYSKQERLLPLKIIGQLPSILLRIYQEHQWLKKVEKKYSINAVFSDNRPGLYHSTIPCIYITHQLSIKTGNAFTEKIVRRIHYWFIQKYTACWVPDFEGNSNLAGGLSHPTMRPTHTTYIGGLSRFKKNVSETGRGLLIIISGPEPQRSIFENIILGQLKDYTGEATVVRGLPGVATMPVSCNSRSNHLTIKNHLPAEELNAAIEAAEWVISRSGYTTVMDLVKLQQKAILVPTPGQTEQEYLAAYLMQQRLFFAAKQNGFVLSEALQAAASFQFKTERFDMELYKKKVKQFVELL